MFRLSSSWYLVLLDLCLSSDCFSVQVSALSENKAPFVVRTPVRKPAPKPVEQPRAPVTPEALPPRNNRAVDKNNVPAGWY